MIGPQAQKAIVVRLRWADIGVPVYDGVKAGTPKPYVVVGEEQTVDTSDQCHDLFELFVDIHVWSEKQGSLVEAKTIGEAVRKCLTGEELSIDGHRLIELTFENSRVLRDPDGVTAHAVLSFRLLLQPV